MGPKLGGSRKSEGVDVCGRRLLVKKSVIQIHRVAAVRAKAMARSWGRRADLVPCPQAGLGRGGFHRRL